MNILPLVYVSFCNYFCFLGTANYLERYGQTINRVASTFGPPPTFKEEGRDAIIAESDAKYPLDQLQERRQWRDSRLVALAKLKYDMNTKE